MTIECYRKDCIYHSFNDPKEYDCGPYCYKMKCNYTTAMDVYLRKLAIAFLISLITIIGGILWVL